MVGTPEQFRVNSKRFYDKNKEKECKKRREHYRKNKKQINIKQKEWYKESKAKAIALYGGRCQICGKLDMQFAFHQKYGVSHEMKAKTHLLALASPEDFALVCKYPCHKFVHHCMDIFGMTWLEVFKFVQERCRSGYNK